MTNDVFNSEHERRIEIARRVLDEGWQWHEREAINFLVVSNRLPLTDAQERRAVSNGADPSPDPSDAQTSPAELDRLSPPMRRKFARSPWSTESMLHMLATDEDALVRSTVASNLVSPPDLLADMWKDTDINVRIGVAGNPQTPTDLLVRVIEEPSVDSMANYLLKNPALPQEAIERAASQSSKESPNVFANSNISSVTLFSLGSVAKDDQVAYYTSTNLAASPEHLQRLTIRCMANLQSEGVSTRKWDKQVEILNQIARHPAASDLTLLNLTTIFGGSPISELILSVCKRPVVPSAYWAAVADLSGGIRSKLAELPNCPVDVLARLAIDPDVYVRTAVHGNPSAPDTAKASARLAGIQ